jgi:ribosomal protein L7/L12
VSLIQALQSLGHAQIRLVVFVMVALMGNRSTTKKLGTLRERGVYPEEGKETDQDVLRLAQAGEKIAAIRCYRSIHNVGLKEAKDAVEAMERSNQKP